MNKPITNLHVISKETISQTTIEIRKSFLSLSIAIIIMFDIGFVPKQVTWAGIQLDSTNINTLKTLTLIMLIYFMIRFSVRGLIESFNWFIRISNAKDSNSEKEIINSRHDPATILQIIKDHPKMLRQNAIRKTTEYLVYSRIVFDYLLPLLVGIYALLLVL